jgi:glycosyltransferase involved in cell wall biosynthesis
MQPVYLNGRFLLQPVTGVQRFAREITTSLDRLWPAMVPAPILLVPRVPEGAPPYRVLRLRAVGRMRGHIWEQFELPRNTRDGLLVNLANAGPIFAKRQLIVLHDTSVFAHPEAYSLPYGLFHRGLDRMLAGTGAQLVTISRFSRAEIARHLRIPLSEIEVIPEGADHVLRVAPDHAFLERCGLASRRYVLAVGSLAAHKNLKALGPLAEALSRRGLVLAVAGGRATHVFGRKAAGLPQPAIYLGRMNDAALRALYESAAAFVFPSRYEGFGIPPVEAMACGCPVVAAAAAVREVCGDGALYADPDDPEAIATAVLRVLEDEALAQDLRRRGHDRAAALTWDNAAAELIRVITRLCKNLSKAPEHEGSDRP